MGKVTILSSEKEWSSLSFPYAATALGGERRRFGPSNCSQWFVITPFWAAVLVVKQPAIGVKHASVNNKLAEL